MQKYKTTATIELFSGKVGLSEKQAAIRAARLKKVKQGVFEVVLPVQFKVGEEIGIECPDKATLANLEPIGGESK